MQKSQEKDGVVAADVAKQADAAFRRFRIMIVDDSDDNARLFGILLRQMGHEVASTYNGEEGLELAKTFRPDIIFSDISMPLMDGLEFAAALKADPATKDVILIAHSGYGDQRHRDDAKAAGFDHYVVKSSDPAGLKTLLASISKAKQTT
ncbi:hypothetical protein BH09SUM1_BH09SUM1_24610 [soil metagenome]